MYIFKHLLAWNELYMLLMVNLLAEKTHFTAGYHRG